MCNVFYKVTRITIIRYIIPEYHLQVYEVIFIRECGIMMRLRELREQRRLTQEGLALKLNTSQSTVSAYEVGERKPDIETLITVAALFDVSLDYIAGLSDVKQRMQYSDLSPDELEHLHTYRQLSKNDKEKLKAYIDGLQSK